MEIRIKHGLDIPLQGGAEGPLKSLPLPQLLALDLSSFEMLRFTLFKKIGDSVKVGEPLAEDKSCPGRFFVSPGSGKVKDIIRGLKRRLLSIVIETDQEQVAVQLNPLSLQSDPKEFIKRLMEGGLMPHIRMRPGLRIAHPEKLPEVIFVKALESAPFAPPSELQVEGREEAFAAGLEVLSRFCPVHLVYRKGCTFPPFTEASAVERHTAVGPHPIANPSVHLAALHPTTNSSQVIWSLDVSDVVAVGMLITKGIYDSSRVISVAGESIPEEKRGFYRVNRGISIRELVDEKEGTRIISGDPLTGERVGSDQFLGFFHQGICAITEGKPKREFLHFLKFRRKGYSATKAYLFKRKHPEFTTLTHGEERPFVDSMPYDRVMPLPIDTMALIKALLTQNYEKAEKLGLLEVLPEDFALPAFLCPSKIEMPEIIREGQKAYISQYLD